MRTTRQVSKSQFLGLGTLDLRLLPAAEVVAK